MRIPFYTFIYLFLCVALRAESEKLAFYMVLSPKNELHTLYSPGDSTVPHALSFYQDRANDPVYPYENACGFGSFLFDPETRELEYAVAYSGLSGRPIMMHFHLGDSHIAGPVVQTIFGQPDRIKPQLGTLWICSRKI